MRNGTFDNGTSIHLILAVVISYESEQELPSSRLTNSFCCYTDEFVSISLSTGTQIIQSQTIVVMVKLQNYFQNSRKF